MSKTTPTGKDWREETLGRMRALIVEADPEMIEERKWKKPSNGMVGVPVWSHDGIICTGETYKSVVKLTFAQGASLKDPSRLFNSSLEGNMRRAIRNPAPDRGSGGLVTGTRRRRYGGGDPFIIGKQPDELRACLGHWQAEHLHVVTKKGTPEEAFGPAAQVAPFQGGKHEGGDLRRVCGPLRRRTAHRR